MLRLGNIGIIYHMRNAVVLDRASFRYYNATGREIDNKNCQCYHHYMPFKSSSSDGNKITHYDNSINYKDNLKNNVDSLLAYAKI